MKISIDLKYKYKKLIKYLIIFSIICFIIYFSTNVSASTVPSSCIFYDNFGTSQTQLLTISGENYFKPEDSFTLTANSYGSLVICSLDTPLVQDNLYSLSYFVELEGTDANSILSKKSNLGIGNTIEQARSSYINNTNTDLKYNNASSSNLSYIFTAKINASFIAIPFGSNKTVSTTPKLTNLSISSNGNVNKLSHNDIQNIIDNSNNKLNDTINDSLNNCKYNYYETYVKLSNFTYSNNKFTQITADTKSDLQWKIQGFNDDTYVKEIVNITDKTIGRLSMNFVKDSSFNRIIFGLNGAKIDSKLQIDVSNLTNNETYTLSFTLLNNVQGSVSFDKLMISSKGYTTYIPSGDKKCTSKLDDTNDKLNDLNDSLKDSKTDGAKNDASNFFNNFTTTDNGGISSIITAPLRMINSLISNSGSCNDLSLKLNMVSIEKDVSIPCGSILWSKASSSTITIYHTIVYGLAAFVILRDLYKQIEDIKNPTDKGVKTTDL